MWSIRKFICLMCGSLTLFWVAIGALVMLNPEPPTYRTTVDVPPVAPPPFPDVPALDAGLPHRTK